VPARPPEKDPPGDARVFSGDDDAEARGAAFAGPDDGASAGPDNEVGAVGKR
jgi:hypothetical protein